MLKVTFDDSGFKRLKRNLESLSRTHSVSFSDLFTPDFMQRRTRFNNFEALIEASGFKVETAEDFNGIPDADWDRFIAGNTSFGSWEAMQKAAGAEWVKHQLARF